MVELSAETKEQIDWFAWHSHPDHIHGWRTPSGHLISKDECPPCVKEREN